METIIVAVGILLMIILLIVVFIWQLKINRQLDTLFDIVDELDSKLLMLSSTNRSRGRTSARTARPARSVEDEDFEEEFE